MSRTGAHGPVELVSLPPVVDPSVVPLVLESAVVPALPVDVLSATVVDEPVASLEVPGVVEVAESVAGAVVPVLASLPGRSS